ncbi:hypothetical protein RISK_002635 [Rhodopirellula islandica]|uniref:Uncharacterized protein n=1 Tax=Rhodopirellula islandica TaxID=595434 RepID=A0A0J1BFW1_RHOIS|nr:hypothetical protein RISK_002635 [Rhodopirellula islandica]
MSGHRHGRRGTGQASVAHAIGRFTREVRCPWDRNFREVFHEVSEQVGRIRGGEWIFFVVVIVGFVSPTHELAAVRQEAAWAGGIRNQRERQCQRASRRGQGLNRCQPCDRVVGQKTSVDRSNGSCRHANLDHSEVLGIFVEQGREVSWWSDFQSRSGGTETEQVVFGEVFQAVAIAFRDRVGITRPVNELFIFQQLERQTVSLWCVIDRFDQQADGRGVRQEVVDFNHRSRGRFGSQVECDASIGHRVGEGVFAVSVECWRVDDVSIDIESNGSAQSTGGAHVGDGQSAVIGVVVFIVR